MSSYTDKLLDFLNNSPVNFLAVHNVCRQLDASGYIRLDASHPVKSLSEGAKFYFTKNDSSVFAFHLGKQPMADAGFHLICAHSDSPCFRIKPAAMMPGHGGLMRLNTELYGGAILSTWFDRPLSIAGRVILRSADPLNPTSRLLHVRRPLLSISSLAIHLNRSVNDGVAISKQKDMLPIFTSLNTLMENDDLLVCAIAAELDVPVDDILDFDLYLYDTTAPCLFGLDNEFISAGRLDDLSMVHAGLEAILADNDTPEVTKVLAIFDNEETGSGTKQGAHSNYFSSLLQRLILSQGGNLDDYYRSLEKAFMISADNAHGCHPNYVEKYDPTNQPILGEGPVIKYNASQKYVTDAVSSAVFQQICAKAGVPFQFYVNHSDVAGGSTLGNILSASLPVRGVDMGNPLLAMHSIRETGSVADHEFACKAFIEFYRCS